MPEPLVRVRDLVKHYRGGALGAREVVHAVDGVSLDVQEGETLGLVGESGCGKSTFGRCMLRLEEPTSGRVEVGGRDITELPEKELRPLRREMQMVFQDPYSSLNPRKKVGAIVGDVLRVHGERDDVDGRVRELLDRVGLAAEHAERYPREFSGGQRQRIGLARALALRPRLIVADEPVSALDVSVQAQVVNLLAEVQRDFGLTYLFIAHDLGVVRHVSDRVGVMYLGSLVEIAPSAELYARPLHPYTEALLSAVPVPDPATRAREQIILRGELPSPTNPPSGCRFHTRCPAATELCRRVAPPLVDHGAGRLAACHYPRSGGVEAQDRALAAAGVSREDAERAAPLDEQAAPVAV
jgi:oligopeptide/dipeptide ABC transporter ATP-binding protein